MASSELISAYERTFGRIKWGSPSTKERITAPEIPGVRQVEINDAEVTRYASHGLANVRIPMDSFTSVGFVIDLAKLKSENLKEPVAIWAKQAPSMLTVRISSGKPYAKESATWLEKERNTQGLYVRTTQLSRVTHPTPYQAEVIPLYLENSTQ